MPAITINAFLTGPGGRFVTAERLQANPALLDSRPVQMKQNPNGGLIITDDLETILVEDSLPDAALFFLEDLPPLLRAGKGGTYQFRTGPETIDVAVKDGTATITAYNYKEIEAAIPQLIEALQAAQHGLDELTRLAAARG